MTKTPIQVIGEREAVYKKVRSNKRAILYNDEIGLEERRQVYRDDMWAISTEELDSLKTLHAVIDSMISELYTHKTKKGSDDYMAGYSEAIDERYLYLKELKTKI